MRKILLTLILSALLFSHLQGQTISIVSPAGLVEPFEVAPGTQVTLRWDYQQGPPSSFYKHFDYPEFPDYGPDPAWEELNNFADNGDGTFDITIEVNESTFILGGVFSPWIGLWYFSNIIEISILSPVQITSADGKLCNNGSDVEILSVADTYTAYQWYFDNEIIEGATFSTFQANQPGKYKVLVPFEGEETFSNTIKLSFVEIQMEGSLSSDQLTLIASDGMDSYQWLVGADATLLVPIENAIDQSFDIMLTPQLTYYSIEGVFNGCVVQSQARPASLQMFTPPVIEVSAEENEFGKVCLGSTIKLSVPDTYASYNWFLDDFDIFNNLHVIEINSEYQQGNYKVEVTNVDWPEVTLLSAEVVANYFTLAEPVLAGAENYSLHCPNENINITLGDEGYAYSWYAHESYNFSESDEVVVPGYTYSFQFQDATYISVEAEFLGCKSMKRIFLNSYANESLSLNLVNYDQTYLCTDSTAVIELYSLYDINKYENYQWYKKTNGGYEIIQGQTTHVYEASGSGEYSLEVNNKNCSSVKIMSYPRTIFDYTERKLYIYADKEAICLNEETLLHIGSEWKSIQWFEKDIIMGSTGYEGIFIPMVTGGAGVSQNVSKFNDYLAKAKHKSCPNGLKTTSESISIVPSLNPSITPDHDNGVYNWHLALYDSIAQYVYCENEPLTLSLSGEFDSYTWHKLGYSGDGNYSLGEEILGQTTNVIAIEADVFWYTAKVEKNGCIGFSDPVLIDAYAFLSPAIEQFGSTELCQQGDSVRLELAFEGNWERLEWYRDNDLIPNSDSNFIYASTPGIYVLVAYPALCPQFAFSSGTGPWVHFLEARIEQQDTLIYAEPWFGDYGFQWFLDGEPFDTNGQPWIHKNSMPNGNYTVLVTNADGCSSLSEEFHWVITGEEEMNTAGIFVFPNPTDGIISLKFTNRDQIKHIHIINMQGQTISVDELDSQVDLTNHPPGVYILSVVFKDGSVTNAKIVRK